MTEQDLMDPERKPKLAGVERAARKVADILPATPLLPLEIDGKTVWCKAECLQPIGAFKIRGGWHRLTDLNDDQRQRGVIAFSSGNHAHGVAWAARRLNIPATIIMPEDAPRAKLENTKALGAKVITYDRMGGNREQLAADLSQKSGAVVVPSFDDPWIVEGQGSCGLEIREQVRARTGSEPDQIVACCGGGGLASGTALANPDAKIMVVEPEGWDDMKRSLEGGAIVPVEDNPPATDCDALQTLSVAPITFNILKDRDATGIAVSTAEVHHAMRVAFEKLRLVVEPGGAVALAALLAGKAGLTDRTAITLSGGNVDRQRFADIIRGS
ncbi:threonine ammonia-lyase [Sphingorhabdus sp. 109]|jgi:threonine dehydratase|uniref:threonine ammonia-lyase n=1 Tax=Sphingorhabdus sp. 109 TaxID=2653173 RepID=UPI0012F0EC75|nr:threonine/serine dehydratase [Sphingorhabdus sp. 109]VWX57161.1 Pyridoxal-5'-phosphate-dependent protein [Sphingorhabdus sp. 109]